jgi:hypothetical protein
MTKKKAKPPLSDTHPTIANEADGWDPKLFHADGYSIKKWKCNLGHIYQVEIISRTRKNQGCPYCSGHRVLAGFNDLATTHPELTKEIIDGDPTKFTRGSDTRFTWICSNKHTWKTSIGNRALRGTGCPTCYEESRGFIGKQRREANIKKANLKTEYPEIAAEAYGWDPLSVPSSSEDKLLWKCKFGHIWSSKPYYRTRKNQKCKICTGQEILSGFNDLAALYPAIAKQMLNNDPSKVSKASQKKYTWVCSDNHQWEATVANRVNRGSGCPVCAGKKVVAGENDLATLHPTIAMQAYGWNPSQVRPGSHKKMKWKCTNGHVFTSSPESRLKEKNEGCKICLKSELLIGFNDLHTTHPEVAMEASGWNPRNIFSGDTKKRNWMCEFGHQWLATPSARTSVKNGNQRKRKGTGCPVCAGKKVVAGENDLAAKYPEIAAQAYGWDPKKFTPNSNKRKKWTCSLGHEWVSSIANRTKQGLGCPTCSNQKVLSGFNDLATVDPKLAREAYGWDPKTVTRGSNKKRKWKCSEGHIWSANIANRSGRGDGCPTCNAHGFDPNENAWLYLLEHDSWEMLQIGITNDPDARTRKHKKLGWKIIELRGPSDGHSTQQWETAILRMLKAKGADLSNEKIAGKFDGYSEAWSKSKFEANSIKELMKLTEEYEEEKSVTNLSHRKTKKDKN